ncbi:MAG: hypothetical protein WBF30_06605, partial [Candidatus Acidiferrales bacterium]
RPRCAAGGRAGAGRNYFASWPATSVRTGVPSIFTASRVKGLSPKACRMVGATCMVVTPAAGEISANPDWLR